MLGYNLKKLTTFPLDVHSRLSLIIILPFDDTQQIPLNNCQIFKEKTDNFPLPCDVMNLNKYFKGNSEDFSVYFKLPEIFNNLEKLIFINKQTNHVDLTE